MSGRSLAWTLCGLPLLLLPLRASAQGAPGGYGNVQTAGDPDGGSTFPWERSHPSDEVGEINTVNGNRLTTILVTGWPGRGGMGVSFSLSHSSEGSGLSEVGHKWKCSYDIFLLITPGSGNANINWGDGLSYTFVKNPNGTFTPPTGIYDTLTYNSSTQKYTLTTKSGLAHVFSNPNGTRWQCDSVTDRNGNSITIAHNASDYVTSVTDPTGRQLQRRAQRS